jgi:hypothetical protein
MMATGDTDSSSISPMTCAALESIFQSRLNEVMAQMRKAGGKNGESGSASRRSTNRATSVAARSRVAPPAVTARAYSEPTARPAVTTAASSANSIEAQAEEAATAAFWAEQDRRKHWLVPMGRDSGSAKIFERRCGMLVALARARALGAKTPLLVDTSEQCGYSGSNPGLASKSVLCRPLVLLSWPCDRLLACSHAVDSYFTYRHAVFVEAKALFLRERTGTPRAELMEELRCALVNAMRHGLTLYVRLANGACDFVNTYSAADTWPLDVFDAPTVGQLGAFADEGRNLAESSHPLAAVLRSDDLQHGVFVPKKGFEVVVCTHFKLDDYADFLDGRLPMGRMQPIVPLPASD